jgi:peptide/nickel transport system substrate-binding protein
VIAQIKGGEDFFQGTSNEVPGIQAPDDFTVRFTLERPNVAWLINPSHSTPMVSILPEHILKDADPAQIDTHAFTHNPNVGTGPYKWVKYVPEQYIEFTANPDYFKGAPKIEKVFIQLPEPPTALAKLQTGEIDIMSKITPPDAEGLKNHQLINVVSAPGVGVFQTAFNNERFPDKRFRQAVMYAVNRADLIKVVLLGEGRLVHSTVIGPDWAVSPDLNPYAFDPAKARELLKEINWDPSRKVTLIWPKGFQDIERAAPVFQQQLKEVGIDVVLSPLDPPAYIKKIVDEADYDMGWFSGGVYAMDPNVSSIYYECDNWTPRGANTTHYCNKDLDKLFVEGRSTADLNKRKEIYHQVAKILNEDVPTLFWWSENIIWGISKRVQGVKPGANAQIIWNIHEWTIA